MCSRYLFLGLVAGISSPPLPVQHSLPERGDGHVTGSGGSRRTVLLQQDEGF